MRKSFLILLFILLAVPAGPAQADYLNPTYYPGVKVSEGYTPPYAAVRPTTSYAPSDFPQSYRDGCHRGPGNTTFKLCTYGMTTGYNYTVMMVGDSHTAHWLPAVQAFSREYKVRILYATKSACAFSAAPRPDYPSCATHNTETMKRILKYRPDVVFAKADQYAHDGVPAGFLQNFRTLEKAGIRVFAPRNTAYFSVNIPDCVKRYGRTSVRCAVTRESQQPVQSNWSKLSYLERPSNVTYIDYAPKMCTANFCYPVQGNVLKVRDSHHMTDSYARTFRTTILRDIMPPLRAAKAARTAS